MPNPVIATLYPCEQNFFAIIFPIPDVDPVTSATLDIFSEFGMIMKASMAMVTHVFKWSQPSQRRFMGPVKFVFLFEKKFTHLISLNQLILIALPTSSQSNNSRWILPFQVKVLLPMRPLQDTQKFLQKPKKNRSQKDGFTQYVLVTEDS